LKVKVGVNGYGTIGKRVADAARMQSDIEVIGIVKTKPDYEALSAVRNGFDLYVVEESAKKFEEKEVRFKGTLNDLLSKVDVIVDATPGGVGKTYKQLYEKYGIKAIFQGGEDADVAEISYSTLCNHEEAYGRNSVRVVSCNTTGLLRLICTLDKHYGVKKVRAVIVRRGADPKEYTKGPINSIVLDPPKVPSHHAADVRTVVPHVNIITTAVAVPTTLMHMHYVSLELKTNVSKGEVLDSLASSPRTLLVSSEDTGIKGTGQLVELARDLGRRRYDIPELVIWEDTVTVVDGRELMLLQSVHQESIVVPENIDAIRAVAKLEKSADATIEKTDKALGLLRGRLA